MGYIVSAHGGRWCVPVHQIWMPDGFSVNYFVDDGAVLSNATAWPIYDALRHNDTAYADARVVETVGPEEMTYNYSCWNYPELGDDCGIFAVGGARILSLAAYPEQNPLTLSVLCTWLQENGFSPGPIYWLACQTAG